ncbi:hypothetical protein N185_19465 [Sinorhizobium sp. GW3]|uniref:hypothetical protein n=1 Tax=Ensifer adhaerens TaxID=106592 RepID=UPI0007266C59|nr:hypothetical protein [Ensifer adhaerens]KSV73914.1 hypothetical protein N185_19465 [Sinorhizobium sp. GW3]MBW0364997.1 hypothetical protein [Ensifer adhaerens]UCM20674.1 hypothetical protein LDL63_03480 [Ensifer adhaerens]
MKIDNSISSYYFSQRRQQAGTIAPIEESGGDARPRQAPTIAPPSTSNALSNALWMTAARDGESTASISAKEGPAASDGSVSDEFLKEAKKSLVEKIREQVLKAMGLTEADLKEMPPEQRQAAEEEIRKAVERAMGVEQQRDVATADLANGGDDIP